MQVKIDNARLVEFSDSNALYFDCSSDVLGPWFSIDVMTKAGETEMYGFGVARDRNFDLVEHDSMIVYKWKFLGTNTDSDHFFTDCYDSLTPELSRRVIATKIFTGSPKIYKAQYIL